MPNELKRTKRNRGGQKGNQNARKHGYYSSALTPDEIRLLGDILNQERIDPEMAVIRVKLQSLIGQSPINPHVLRKVSGLIAKWSAKKYRLNRADRAILKAAVEDALARSSGIALRQPSSFPQRVGNPKNELSSVGRKI